MLNYAETASISTIVSVEPLPQKQRRETTTSLCSYIIGPIDSMQIITMHAQLSTGGECPPLVPVSLPQTILAHAAFRDGYEYNYLSEEEEEEPEEWMTMVTRLVNHVYTCLTDTRDYHDLETGEVSPDFLPWQVGWLLRNLTRLAETDRTLALVGIGHLCFLLPLIIHRCPVTWPCHEPYHAANQHRRAIKAYRACVRFYREQGKSYEEAQQMALGTHA